MAEREMQQDLRMTPKKHNLPWWVWIFVIIAVFLFVYFAMVGIGAVLIVADPIQAVDAVVVLSGDDGDRLELAIEMHEQGWAPNLVITNVSDTVNQRLAAEAQAGGFAKNEIYITKIEVESTVDEALAVREIAFKKSWTTLMVRRVRYYHRCATGRWALVSLTELVPPRGRLAVRFFGNHKVCDISFFNYV